MDNLKAQQIVLLTLLVSFVTSIATGITTVSLMEKAPDPVIQTINRVVEKTVERVVEVNDEEEVKTEKIVETIIVREEDALAKAVENNSASLVRLYSIIGDLKNFVGIGLVVSDDVKILADSQNIINENKYVAVFSDGKEYSLDIVSNESNSPFSIFKLSDISTKPENIKVAKLASLNNLKLGQSVVAVSGKEKNIINIGIVTSIDMANLLNASSTPSEEKTVSFINTSIDKEKILEGSILISLSGEIVGGSYGIGIENRSNFLPVEKINNFISSF